MDKHVIFDHLMSTFQYVGKLNNADVTTGEDSAVITKYPSPLFNVVRFDTKNHGIIDKLKDENIPFICIPSKNMETEFETFIEGHDLVKADFVTASYKNLENLEYKVNQNIQIRMVTNLDDMKEFDRISSVAFQHPEGLAFDFLKSVISNTEICLFIAYEKDLPVGCAMISFINNQAGLYWNGVLPEFRMHGIATTLVEYRMNYAKELGYQDIISQNMTPSLNLYKRLGFEQLGGLPLYIQL